MSEITKQRVIRVRVIVDTDNDEQKQYSFKRDTILVVSENDFNKTLYGIIQNIKHIKNGTKTTRIDR